MRKNSQVTPQRSVTGESGPTPIPKGQGDFVDDALEMLGSCAECLNPQAQNKIGRRIQMTWITIFASLFIAATFVQVYIDVEHSIKRQNRNQEVSVRQKLVLSIYDAIIYVGLEMELAYEYNNASYDIYAQKTQDITRALDQMLLWNGDWPDEQYFVSLTPAQREVIITPTALRSTIRAHRDARKTTKMSDIYVMQFYAGILDTMSVVGRAVSSVTPPFRGWFDFLLITTVFQTWMNVKKGACISKQFIRQNATIDQRDPLFLLYISYYTKYSEYIDQILLAWPETYVYYQTTNLTGQDTYKTMLKQIDLFLKLDMTKINLDEFGDAMRKVDVNFEWVFYALRNFNLATARKHADDWEYKDLFSVPMFTIAGVIAFATFLCHIGATLKTQSQIEQYHVKLHNLEKALGFIYDCIPKGLIHKYNMPVRHFEHVCVMITDIFNIEGLVSELEIDKFAGLMEEVYQVVEMCLRRYNCFKVDISGYNFVFGGGVGEHHALDHVLEMILLGLDLQTSLSEMTKREHYGDVLLRTGIHCGSCFSRIVHLQVPVMAIVGRFMQKAALLHAIGLPTKILVSENVYGRVGGMTEELTFLYHGRLVTDTTSLGQMNIYWVDQAITEDRESDAGST